MGKKVGREDFLRRLQTVAYGLSSREIQEQSNCIIVTGGEMVTFNDEICCRAPSPLGDFTGAVRASKLIEILEKREDDELEVEAGNGRLAVKGKGGKSWVYCEAEVRLDVGGVEVCEDWKPLHGDFAEAVRVVQECSSHDASSVTSMIHVHPKYLEAFDDFQFIRYKVAGGVSVPAQVKQSSLKNIVQLGLTELGETDNWVHFRKPGELTFSCRRYLEEYKDLSPLFKLEPGEILSLPNTLGEAVARAEVFSAEQEDNVVRVELRPGKMRIRGAGASGGHWEVKTMAYKGRPCAFNIGPKMLAELPKKGNEIHLTSDRLWVNGGKYRYVTILEPVGKEENGNGE